LKRIEKSTTFEHRFCNTLFEKIFLIENKNFAAFISDTNKIDARIFESSEYHQLCASLDFRVFELNLDILELSKSQYRG